MKNKKGGYFKELNQEKCLQFAEKRNICENSCYSSGVIKSIDIALDHHITELNKHIADCDVVILHEMCESKMDKLTNLKRDDPSYQEFIRRTGAQKAVDTINKNNNEHPKNKIDWKPKIDSVHCMNTGRVSITKDLYFDNATPINVHEIDVNTKSYAMDFGNTDAQLLYKLYNCNVKILTLKKNNHQVIIWSVHWPVFTLDNAKYKNEIKDIFFSILKMAQNTESSFLMIGDFNTNNQTNRSIYHKLSFSINAIINDDVQHINSLKKNDGVLGFVNSKYIHVNVDTQIEPLKTSAHFPIIVSITSKNTLSDQKKMCINQTHLTTEEKCFTFDDCNKCDNNKNHSYNEKKKENDSSSTQKYVPPQKRNNATTNRNDSSRIPWNSNRSNSLHFENKENYKKLV
jgi:hypothetical protein